MNTVMMISVCYHLLLLLLFLGGLGIVDMLGGTSRFSFYFSAARSSSVCGLRMNDRAEIHHHLVKKKTKKFLTAVERYLSKYSST